MTALIIQTVLIALIALLGGIIIGIALAVNESKTPDNPTLDAYNRYINKQVNK